MTRLVYFLFEKRKFINYYNSKKTFRNQKRSKYIHLLRIGALGLLYFFKIFVVFKTLFREFFILFVYKPGRKFLSFVFYKILVKIYFLYLRIVKKLGLERVRSKFIVTLNQRLVHFLVIVMTVLLIFVNLSIKAKANDSGFIDQAHHTILAELVTSELGGFMEDEKLVVEAFDQNSVISNVEQTYLDNLSNIHSQLRVSFQDANIDEGFEPVINSSGSMIRPNIIATKITEQERTETLAYTVLPGDTISVIAEKFGVSVSTILWENNLSSYSIIRPNDVLYILPMTGISHKVLKNETISSIAKKYDVDEEVILNKNKLAKTDNLQVGKKLLIPGGKKTIYRAPAPKTYTGFTAIKNIVSTPISEISTGNKMAWPTVGHRITQYYSWRHHGLDIANKIGTPLYAADSGVIEYAGWGTGYGYYVLIDHGGNKKTRYAHMSKFYVKKGDKVSKGMPIGEMGSTGWSTGPHVHFEVIINGKKYNPLNYIK